MTFVVETTSWKGIFRAENSIAVVWVIGWIVFYRLKTDSLLDLMQKLECDIAKLGMPKDKVEEIKETRIL